MRVQGAMAVVDSESAALEKGGYCQSVPVARFEPNVEYRTKGIDQELPSP